MKLTIETSIDIVATPENIWGILMDFASYPEWNPFIRFISGDPVVGERLEISAGGTKFKPVVTESQPYRKFSWFGNLWIKGLFDGEHIFEIIHHRDEQSTFVHRENFSGWLVPLLKGKLLKEVRPSFIAMNQQLKALAEATSIPA